MTTHCYAFISSYCRFIPFQFYFKGHTTTTYLKIAQAEALKNKGNTCFKQDDRKEALRHYHEAIMYIHGLNMSQNNFIPTRASDVAITEEQKIAVDSLMTSIYGNIAACHLKDSNWQQVIKYSSKALEKDVENLKARIRRVNAQLSIGALDKAADDLAILLDKHAEGR
ncbi:hypothetical protein BDF22DRAFT_690923 [Syncephalis plumigaleata]|nr:hypothetical protein BDF22DRAFT_690923 [Syncephalis plumigaleata]